MRWIATPEKGTDTVTFERRLWDVADQFRANSGLKAQEYSGPILGLIFLRFAEVRFAAQRARLDEADASPRRGSRVDEPAAYHAEGFLYLAPEARFDHLLTLPEAADIGAKVNAAMRDIEKHNPHLAGVLPARWRRHREAPARRSPVTRRMQSNVGMKSIPCDMIVFDELDEASPDAKALAKERLSHSDYRRVIELSNPSIPSYGIDESYQESDQRHWTIRCQGCGKWTAPEKAFPTKLGQEVEVIREPEDGTCYLACPACGDELDPSAGIWVADFPDRPIHGYRISQLFSSKIDPAEILREYRKTYNPERFYTLKIGIPWVDVSNKLSAHEVLALCGDKGLLERSDRSCTMGVDTGRELHVVVSRSRDKGEDDAVREVIWIGTAQSYEELDSLMERFKVSRCVIDAMPEIHATREFADRHRGHVWMNYFIESQKGAYKWDEEQHIVQVNRTEALDAAKKAIRDGEVVLPRRAPLLEEFAQHLASDAKKLIEDEETGSKTYKYIKTGTNHYSLAFTYDWIASERERRSGSSLCFAFGETIMGASLAAHARSEGFDWPFRWDRHREF